MSKSAQVRKRFPAVAPASGDFNVVPRAFGGIVRPYA
jgi:hypothetical protein